MGNALQTTLLGDEIGILSPDMILDRLKQANWKKSPYKYQNWGNWLHRMSAYVGKINPAMAHWIIKSSSNVGDVVLDPFCGVGTIPLEADLLGRIGIGIDLNPYAFTICRAKFDRSPMEEHLSWLDSIVIDTSKIDLHDIPKSVIKYYHPETLKEIIFIKDLLVKEKKYFLLGCLLGIIHGHRPGHLSAITSLVIPYKPRTKPEYKEVIPRLKQKVRRMYKSGFPLETNSKAYYADARNIPLEDDSIDLVISSPPYFNTLDYVGDNWLRLEFLGFDEKQRGYLKHKLIQNKTNYLDEMRKVGIELRRVIKDKGYCIFILGDLHNGKNVVNTSQEVKKVYEDLGFTAHGILDDDMPVNKCIPSNYKRQKLDRILVMTNE